MAAERAITDGLAEWFRKPGGRHVRLGIGDDAAVLAGTDRDTVYTCDPVVEGVHFAADAPLAAVGRKVVNRNLSDLAAMGARPRALLVSVLLPGGVGVRRRRSLFEGIRRAAAVASCPVIGGDLARTPGPLTVTVTAVGELSGRPLLRSGLVPGATLHVTGPLGGALRGKHLRFAPRLREGQWLAANDAVIACIDVSDGLLLDLDRMLQASQVAGATLDAAQVPISRAAQLLAAETGQPALEHALGDGEDYELLFAVAPGARLRRGGPLSGVAHQALGVVDAQPGVRLREVDGSVRTLDPRGYEHEF